MNFTSEQRKEVFDFFYKLLSTYNEPVYYENLRGHVSKASEVIRKYVLRKCRGDDFLKYFQRRKNYFIVEHGYLTLKKDFHQNSKENSLCSSKKKIKNKVLRRPSFTSVQSVSSIQSTSSNVDENRKYEDITIIYFKNRFIRKKKERISSIEIGELPKKVKRHIQTYYKNKIQAFFSSFPDKFNIDENEIVSIAYGKEPVTNCTPSIVNTRTETCPDSSKNKNDSFSIDPEILKASHYLECIIYFVKILKKLPQPYPVVKLGGFLSQASKEIKEHIKYNYKSFKYFINDPSLIFLKNNSEEVSLSKEYKILIKEVKKIITDANNESVVQNNYSKPVITLKSRINFILTPQYSPCFEQRETGIPTTISSNDVLSPEEMLDIRHVFDEISRSQNYKKANSEKLNEITELHQSTEILNFYDTYINKTDAQDSGHFDDVLLRCVFTIELYCLEFIEKENEYIEKYEVEAVKYFMEILDTSSTKIWTVTSLQGTLRNKHEIAHFMNKVYKGDKFYSFFQKYPQFTTRDKFISLTIRNRTDYPGSFDTLSFHQKAKNELSLNDAYESSNFKELLRNTYAFLHETCKFLKNKTEIKINKLYGILSHYKYCYNMITFTKGESVIEKIEKFLRLVGIFDFPNEGNILFSGDCCGNNCSLLLMWFEKNFNQLKDSATEFMNLSHFLEQNVTIKPMSNCINPDNNSTLCWKETFMKSVDVIKNAFANDGEIHYFEVLKMIPSSVLQAIAENKKDSRYIIYTLQKSRQFILKSGSIAVNYKSDLENCDSENISVPSSNINNDQVKITNGFDISKELFTQHNIINGIRLDDISLPSDKIGDGFQCKLKQFSEILETDMKSENHVSENKICNIIEEVKETISEKAVESDLNFSSDKLLTKSVSENFDESEHSYSEKIIDLDSSVDDENKNLNFLSSCNPAEDIASDHLSGVFKDDVKVNEETVNLDFAKEIISTNIISINDNTFNLENESVELAVCKKQFNIKIKNDIINSFLNSNEENAKEIINSSDDHVSNEVDCIENFPISSTPENFILDKYERCSNQDPNCSSVCEELKFDRSEIQLNENGIVSTATKAEDLEVSSAKITEIPFDLRESYDKDNLNVSVIPINLFSVLTTISPEDMGEDYENQNNSSLQSTKNYMFKDDKNKDKFSTVFTNTSETSKILKKEYFEVIVPKILNFDVSSNQSQSEESPTRATDISTSFENRSTDQILNETTNDITIFNTKESSTCIPEEFIDTSYSKDLNLKITTIRNNEVSQPIETLHELLSEAEARKSSTKLSDSFKILQSSTIDKIRKNEESLNYPMQPITAKIVVLTNDSCIAISEINQHTQSIYIRKCVFQCDHLDDCSDCFNSLKIGDKISCFVPLTEMSHKIWIAFLVSKDSTENFVDFDKSLQKLYGSGEISDPSRNLKSVSVQTENSTSKLSCQTEFTKSSNKIPYEGCKKLHKTTKEVECQVNAAPVVNAFTQTENEAKTCDCDTQTDIRGTETLFRKKITGCQTDISGNIKGYPETEDIFCQTDLSGLVMKEMKNLNAECQTFSTGPIMMLAYHPI